MQAADLIQVLRVVKDKLRLVLDSDANRVIDEAIANISASKADFDRFQHRSDLKNKPVTDWGYDILNTPLRFRISRYNKYNLRADILCNIRWEKEGELPLNQQLVLRVWSADADIMYRPEWDSSEIGEQVTGQNPLSERVMLRYHFDLANNNQEGPKYHMQLGGNALEGENVWFPKELDLPRIIHHPMELILLCQIVTANFFPEEYRNIRRDPVWAGAIKKIEHHLLLNYYTSCIESINSSRSLLDCLWNIQD